MKTINLVLHLDATHRIEIYSDALNFYGPTVGYPYPESKDKELMSLSFRPVDTEHLQDIVEALGNDLMVGKVWARNSDQFEDYVKDRRPRIEVAFRPGHCGLANPPEFELVSVEKE